MSPRLNSGYRSSELCRDIEGQDVGKHEASQQLVLLRRPFFVAVAVGHFPFALSPSGSVSQSFFRMIFNRRARDRTELIVRFRWRPISPELAPASANFRRLSSSACVHGREAWRAGSFISPSPSAQARPGGTWLLSGHVFRLGRSIRASRNSSGPLSKWRFRLACSSAGAPESARRSICTAARSRAVGESLRF
jgi:hypothetical protein